MIICLPKNEIAQAQVHKHTHRHATLMPVTLTKCSKETKKKKDIKQEGGLMWKKKEFSVRRMGNQRG